MKNKEKLLLHFLNLIIITILLTGCASNDYYNGIKWGSSVEDVENKLDKNITVSNDKSSILQIIEDFDNISGSQAAVMYYFDNNKLSKITITVSSNTDSDIELNQKIYNNFVKKYGECSSSNQIEYEWSTKYSDISLTVTSYIKYTKSN